MRSISLDQLPSNLPAALMTSVKIILSLLFLLYAYFHFSTLHWVLFGLLGACVAAIMYRISRLDSAMQMNDTNKLDVIHSDGGAFRQVQQNNKERNVHPVVSDGGLIKRKH
jgi:hypothetical protein